MWVLYRYFLFLFSRTRFHFNPKPNDGGLFICCGQLVGKKGGPRHMNCPGSNSGYRVGGLFLEMEYCPFAHCVETFVDPESNISHQEEVHRSIRTWMCTLCEINFVSEGCATRHMLTSHRGPKGYAEDLRKVREDSRPFSFSTWGRNTWYSPFVYQTHICGIKIMYLILF